MANEEKKEGEEKLDKKEEKEKEKEKAAEGGKGKRKIFKLGIIGLAVLMVLGGGFFGWRVFSKKGGNEGEHAKEAAVSKEEEKKDAPGHMIALDPFIVNLADTAETRYLKITINLEVENEEISAEVGTRTPQLRDALLMLLTSKASGDVKDIAGKLKLQDEMVTRANNFLQTGKVKAVYFSEFVMQ